MITNANSSPFTFSTVPNIVSEPGIAKRLGDLVTQHFPQARRALLVTDNGFLKTGLDRKSVV